MSGALIGTRLGFNATSSLLSMLTAIVGAAVGANLILLILDMTWDRSNSSRFPLSVCWHANAGHCRTCPAGRLTNRRRAPGNDQICRFDPAAVRPLRGRVRWPFV